VRDELEQLLDDDDDMADLYLSRKLAGVSSPVSGSGGPNWFPSSPTLISKLSRASRASAATIHGNENDVEELEMLLEVGFPPSFLPEAMTYQFSLCLVEY
jgi:magnesium transporter